MPENPPVKKAGGPSQTPQKADLGGVGGETPQTLKKVGSLEEVLKTPNSQHVYAIIRGRNNTVIKVKNRGGLLSIHVLTITKKGVRTYIDPRILKKLVIALNDLYNELVSLGFSNESKIKEY